MPRPFDPAEREHIRRALLDAARAQAARGGLRRVPVETLTRSAGISKGAFYLFFPSKQALLVELLRETEAQLRAGIESAAHTGPAENRLERVLYALFRGVAAHPLLTSLTDREEYTWLARYLPPGALPAARADDDEWSTRLVHSLVVDGALEPDAPSNLFTSLGAVALSVASQPHLLDEADLGATTRLLVEAFVMRLRAPA